MGMMWGTHHNIFRYIGRSNHLLVMLNIWLLMGAAFLPYPTAVLAAYLRVPDARTAAPVFYGGTLTFTASAVNAAWRYAASGRRLLRPHADPLFEARVARASPFRPHRYANPSGVGFFKLL